MENKLNPLENFRKQIDNIDEEILEIFNRRAKIVQQVGELKSKDKNPVYTRHDREAKMLRELARKNPTPIRDKDLQAIYREIISAFRALEKKIQITYLGPEGTYSEIVAKVYFGNAENIDYIPQKNLCDIFAEVSTGRITYGVLPIENSYEGPVSGSIDELIAMGEDSICAEIKMQINHFLLSKEENIDAINTLFTHEQTYAQCSNWIQKNNPQWQIELVQSNGLAAQLASQTPNSAAIAAKQAGEKYELNTLIENIQNHNTNTTRFLIIGNHTVDPTGCDTTTCVFALNNEPGALNKALNILAEQNINMTQIISRPARSTNWEYLFLIDLSGHKKDPHLAAGLKQLKKAVPMLKILGSYPISPSI
jgi:chorismate mutase/prephenate dehydratase